MTHEDQEAAEAGHAGDGHPQGVLTRPGGRVPLAGPRPPAPLLRLKRSVQAFPASDGSIYLVRLGAGDDLIVSEPRPADRALLELLAAGRFVGRRELQSALVDDGFTSAELDQTLALLGDAGVLETAGHENLLEPDAAERYDRQLIYFGDLAEPGESAPLLQRRLTQASVAVLGCGGLGSWVACGLSGAGVGRLILVDDDRIELSNLNRQLAFTEARVGDLKTDVVAGALRANNSQVQVLGVERRVRSADDVAAILRLGADLLVVTADWPPHDLSRWVNEACMACGVPWIAAGQFPPKVRVGPLVVPGRSACHECLEIAARRDHPLYDELARWRARGETPDASVGPICGLIGSLLACEVMHFLVGRPPASVDHALLLDLQTMELTREAVARDPSCRCYGTTATRPLSPR